MVNSVEASSATRQAELVEHAQKDVSARCPVLAHYNPLAEDEVLDPYPSWEIAQREAPILYVEAIGMWMATSFDVMSEIVRDTETFSNEGIFQVQPVPEELAERLPYGWPAFGVSSLINSDPPAHTAIRKLTQQVLTPRRIAAHEPRIREIARTRLEKLHDRGKCDYIADFAKPFVAEVLADILGVEEPEVRSRFAQWSDDAFTIANPHLPREEVLELGSRLADLKDYLEQAVERRRVEPADDLLSLLAHATDDEAPMLTTRQIVGLVCQLVNAGTETTTGLISNSVYLTRTRYPELWTHMKDDPSIIPAVLEEMLRVKPPVRGFMRITSREVEIAGTHLPQGAIIFMANAAASSDSSRFPEPRKFELNRSNIKQHFGFGRGAHFCIGAPLGRLDARVALEETLRLMPDIAVDDSGRDIRWLPMLFSQGLSHLPVTWSV